MAKETEKLLSLVAYDNPLTEDPTDYQIRVKVRPETFTREDIAEGVIERMLQKMDKSTVMSILEAADEVMIDAATKGYVISTDFLLSKPGASGNLHKGDLSKAVDRTQVRVYASISMGPKLRSGMNSCPLEIFKQPAVQGPLVNGVYGQRTVDDDGTVTRAPIEEAGLLEIQGLNIKVAGSDPGNGVTLTSVANPATTYFIPLKRLSTNEPKTLAFILPKEIKDGTSWRVTVTTQYIKNSRNTTKAPRSYTFDEIFTVGQATNTGGNTGGGNSGGGNDGGMDTGD